MGQEDSTHLPETPKRHPHVAGYSIETTHLNRGNWGQTIHLGRRRRLRSVGRKRHLSSLLLQREQRRGANFTSTDTSVLVTTETVTNNKQLAPRARRAHAQTVLTGATAAETDVVAAETDVTAAETAVTAADTHVAATGTDAGSRALEAGSLETGSLEAAGPCSDTRSSSATTTCFATPDGGGVASEFTE